MANAVAHGVTKTKPNATERRAPGRVMAALWLFKGWANETVAPFTVALEPPLRIMTSREPIDCGLY